MRKAMWGACLALAVGLPGPFVAAQEEDPGELDRLKAELVEVTGKMSAVSARIEELLLAREAEAAAAARDESLALLEKKSALIVSIRKAAEAAGEDPDAAVAVAVAKSDPLRAVIDKGLAWLARHQEEDGSWSPDDWWRRSSIEMIDGLGKAAYRPGVTALALLAFLHGGHTRGKSEYRVVVRSGLRYLRTIQDEAGCFGPTTFKHYVYNHAIATLVMVRMYETTHSSVYRRSAESGVKYAQGLRNPGAAWRYGVRPGDNDVSCTGWMVVMLEAARAAGLKVDDAAFGEAREWVDRVTDPESGRVGYHLRGEDVARPQDLVRRFPPGRSAATTAEGIAIRLAAGIDPARSELTKRGAALIRGLPPTWDRKAGTIDMYYWLWGTHTALRLGGKDWSHWRKQVLKVLMANQAKDERVGGSWDPVGPWCPDGGRVYSTAVMTMIAETVHLERSWVGPGS